MISCRPIKQKQKETMIRAFGEWQLCLRLRQTSIIRTLVHQVGWLWRKQYLTIWRLVGIHRRVGVD
ncbi:hypothetical protein CJF30_00001939 [Rutstroemia sp. NJR-2017a BBW]|nr:hypothetical protein CJF30_00001939 [Rutstroemia sp. NJR-2017a BBW]